MAKEVNWNQHVDRKNEDRVIIVCKRNKQPCEEGLGVRGKDGKALYTRNEQAVNQGKKMEEE